MPNLLVASEAVDVVFNNCTVKKDKERWTPEQQEAREEQETSKIPSKGVLKQKSKVSKETVYSQVSQQYSISTIMGQTQDSR